jgi:carbon monoxide dehydrogenase subunit G
MSTRLVYTATGQIGGKLAQIGARLGFWSWLASFFRHLFKRR